MPEMLITHAFLVSFKALSIVTNTIVPGKQMAIRSKG
jgi:hypothetical protein